MTNTNISTIDYKYRSLQRLVLDAAPDANLYYFFVGDHIPHANATLIQPNNSMATFADAYNKMILGKQISYLDFAPVIRFIGYEADKVFTMYDDQEDLANVDFYCVTTEGSYNHVWKCLDNNNESNSTVQPVFAEGANTPLYQTSDGYRWHYMTSVANSMVAKFKTSAYFPLVANTEVTNNAVAGSLDIIRVIGQGKYYSNYIDGTFRTVDLRINGDATVYGIANNTAVTSNGFYTGCLIYITEGTGQGQFQTIIDYVSNTEGNYIKLDDEFLVPPLNGSVFEIRPEVKVTSVGVPTINCVARALVNSVGSNTVYRVEVLQRGEGYVSATANVVANAIVGLNAEDVATVRPIFPPSGGHGHNIFNELYCHDVEVSVTLSNSESNTVPTSNMFQSIGLIRNPRFGNVNLTFADMQGAFVPGESLFAVDPIQMNTNATVTANSTTITCNNAKFATQFTIGMPIVLVNLESTAAQIATINSITSNTSLELTANMLFSCTETIMFFANVISVVEVSSVEGPNNIFIANCGGNLFIDQFMIGSNTGSFGYISTIARNDVEKTFLTYNQLYKYSANLISGSFTQNEVVIQGNTTAYVHSVEGSAPNITVYVSGFSNGIFAEGSPIVGNTGGGIAEITKAYDREVIYGSGEILYLENIEPITRLENQNEQFQIVLNY